MKGKLYSILTASIICAITSILMAKNEKQIGDIIIAIISSLLLLTLIKFDIFKNDILKYKFILLFLFLLFFSYFLSFGIIRDNQYYLIIGCVGLFYSISISFYFLRNH